MLANTDQARPPGRPEGRGLPKDPATQRGRMQSCKRTLRGRIWPCERTPLHGEAECALARGPHTQRGRMWPSKRTPLHREGECGLARGPRYTERQDAIWQKDPITQKCIRIHHQLNPCFFDGSSLT